ncbi:hypothetical protein SPAR_37568 [Streptomyces sparsogenes DSM 40356]|uniref:Uncharacterized protein n=1 Tax=Streptomyces sparsogenes DSM 40356 TaxID=1331668 RepID=A0A1R1S7E5_9ACTN|nr:hypothetical protein SPAR_37568 [Streptomyces sparsogenes DSM 40356]
MRPGGIDARGPGRLDGGGMARTSSSPNRPPSPACGLTPATAIRGEVMPRARSSSWASSTMPRTRSAVISVSALARGRWVVTRTVRSSSLASIMAWRGAPVSAARVEVWSGWAMPAACQASLWIGAVTMPSSLPSSARRTAVST